ncbi:unnamed protein product [Polarella glacialis]|uniref:LicD/FKTN/FKRP nucleotidyltransferase domain-containing protein n=1 Tax=Polarella glacialis TaxID=89957 RepID=A0A813FPT7_POLGL|nr:unnamed protein product [Polarella glacialis]
MDASRPLEGRAESVSHANVETAGSGSNKDSFETAIVESSDSKDPMPMSGCSKPDRPTAASRPFGDCQILQRHRADILLWLLQATDELLTGAGIPYWICGGTLIGALRHQGFIPHDDDVDIECFETDTAAIAEACRLSAMPVAFHTEGSYKGCCRMGHLFFYNIVSKELSVDVFLRREQPLCALDEFPGHAEVFPLRRYPFHSIAVCGPGGCVGDYLARCYGPHWSESVRIWSHSCPEGSEGSPAELPIEEYREAVAQSGYQSPTVRRTAAESLKHLSREGGELELLLWEVLGWASPLPPPQNSESLQSLWESEEED